MRLRTGLRSCYGGIAWPSSLPLVCAAAAKCNGRPLESTEHRKINGKCIDAYGDGLADQKIGGTLTLPPREALDNLKVFLPTSDWLLEDRRKSKRISNLRL